MIEDSDLLAMLALLRHNAHPDYHPAFRLMEGTARTVYEDHKRVELRRQPASELELSVRAANMCKLESGLGGLGLKTVGDVEAFFSRSDPLWDHAGRPLGKKVVKEVRELLQHLGLNGPRRNAEPG